MLVMFSSRSGSDCIYICEMLKAGAIIGHKLSDVSKIVTNRKDSPLIDYCYENSINCVVMPNKPTYKNYNELAIPDEDLILLNGWLRIIPEEFTYHRQIFNLHPGLITEYPELKGLDPQERAWKHQYDKYGCVIHRVIPEVDEGEVVLSKASPVNPSCLEDLYFCLGQLAKDMWVEFLNKTKW